MEVFLQKDGYPPRSRFEGTGLDKLREEILVREGPLLQRGSVSCLENATEMEAWHDLVIRLQPLVRFWNDRRRAVLVLLLHSYTYKEIRQLLGVGFGTISRVARQTREYFNATT